MSAAIKLCDYKTLTSFIPLNQLDADKCNELAQKSSLRHYKSDERIFKLQDDDNHLFYLLSGSIEITHESKKILLKAGSAEAASHLSMLNDKNVKITSKSPASMLVVNQDLLDLLLNWDSSNGYEVDEISSEQEGDWVQGILQNSALLKLSPNNIQAIMACIETIQVKAGQAIIKQGEADHYYYIISKGRCRVSQKHASKEVVLAELAEGDSFGEEALITETARNATITMIEDGLLLRLNHDDFSQFLKKQMVRGISQEIAEDHLKNGAQWIDVRSPEEHVKNGIGLNMPLASTRIIANELNNNRIYILYCDNGHRSSVAAFLLRQRGLDVYVLDGGLEKHGAILQSQRSISDDVGNLIYLKKNNTRHDSTNKSEAENTYLKKINDLEQALKKSQETSTQANQSAHNRELEALHAKHKHELSLYTQVNNDINSQLKQQKVKLITLEKIITQYEGEIHTYKSQTQQQEAALKNSAKLLSDKEQDMVLLKTNHNNALQQLENKLTSQQTTIDELTQQLQQQAASENETRASSEHNIALLAEEIAELKDSNNTFKENIASKTEIIDNLNAQIDIHLNTINTSSELANELKSELSTLQATISQDNNEIELKDASIHTLQHDITSLNEKYENEKKSLICDYEKKIAQASETMASHHGLDEAYKLQSTTILELEQTNSKMTADFAALQEKFSQLSQQTNVLVDEKSQLIEQHTEQKNTLETQLATFQQDIKNIQHAHDEQLSALSFLDGIQQESADLKNSLQQLNEEKVQAQKEISNLTEQLAQVKIKVAEENTATLTRLEKQVTTLQSQLAQAEQHKNSSAQELNTLHSEIEKFTHRAELAERTVEVLEFQLNRHQLANSEAQ